MPAPSTPCIDCGGKMVVIDYQRICMECGLIDDNYQAVGLNRGNAIIKKTKYKPRKHFQTVLDRLQSIWTEACSRFDAEYMERLSAKLERDHSLKNIHRHLPNKDQRYLNYIYTQLTGEKLYIEWQHMDFLKNRFCRCYEEYDNLEGKRPCALNILQVVVNYYPTLHYIKPYIYTKFNLSKVIYNRLRDVCQQP